MCGIAGLIGWSGTDYELKDMEIKIKSSLKHRGPDSKGHWSSKINKVHFFHTRLSILDLSSSGHQPMQSSCGRYIICFNGEIYNHLKLRQYLKKIRNKINWKSNSDTETLIELISLLGLNKTLKKIRGMFAFSIFDKKTKKLNLIRDRFGEKPLYLLTLKNNIFAFASEIEAFNSIRDFSPSLDMKGVACFFNRGYISAPLSIWQSVEKIMPGTNIEFTLKQDRKYHITKKEIYWSVKDIAVLGQRNLYQGSYEDCKSNIENILLEVLEGQRLSDVPIGVFLSGGVDSSIVAALMQKISSKKIKTFSIGFDNEMYDESKYAEAVASHLNTEHITLKANPIDAINLVEKMPNVYCEPFADSSQIPTTLLSSLVKQHVSVALSGDGGDEIFSGYSRYIFAHNTERFLFKCPLLIRKYIAKSIKSISPEFLNLLGKKIKINRLGDKAFKTSEVMLSEDFESYYNNLISYWPNSTIVSAENEIKNKFLNDLGNIENMMLADQLNYLPNDILTKVDRASMSVSLETRAPFLDHILAEFAWSIPLEWRINQDGGKRILRDVLYNFVPRKLIDRPKQGFGLPVNEWLRGPLKDWALNLFDKKILPDDGMLNGKLARQTLDEHLKNIRNWDYKLWPLLMWQQWNLNKGLV